MKFLIVLVMLLFPLVQGFQTQMNSSVTLSPNLEQYLYPSSYSYCPGEVLNITVQVINVGNNQTVFFLNETVYDQYGDVFDNRTWFEQQILPSETKNYYLTRNISESDVAGTYTVVSSLKYANKEIVNQTFFRIKQKYGTLVASPSFIEETVFPGDFVSKDLYLWLLFPCYGAEVFLNKSGEIADWIYFSRNPVYVPPETWNVTRITIFVDLPWNVTPGEYTGMVTASIENEVQLYIPIKIHVQTTAIFDLQTEVLSQYKEVCKGGEVKARVYAIKVFPPGPMDVNMTYRIEFVNQTYAERKEVVMITNTIEKFVSLTVPSNAPEGVYTYYTILDVASENWKVNISSYDTFNVMFCQPPISLPTPAGGKVHPLEVEEAKRLEIKLTKYKILGIIGNLSSFAVKAKNLGSSNLTNIKLEIKGVPPEWITVSPYKIDRLVPGEEKEFLVFIKPPLAAKEGVYQIKVKAKDAVESNEETALLLLSKDERGLTLMLYEQSMKAKQKAEQTLSLTCLDISEIKTLMVEGDNLMKLGKDYMDGEEYKKSQEVLLEAIKVYESVVEKANILMLARYEKIKPFVLPPFINSFKKAKLRLDIVYSEKNYLEFCPSLSNATKYIAYSIAEITILLLLLILLAIYAYHEYKKYRERKVEERLKEIKKRLEET